MMASSFTLIDVMANGKLFLSVFFLLHDIAENIIIAINTALFQSNLCMSMSSFACLNWPTGSKTSSKLLVID
jgi:hypothetical protein